MKDTPTRRTVLKTIAGTGIAAVGTASVLPGITDADATGDIPSHYLDQYRQTGTNWGLDWTYLAGIGWVETQHGQYEPGCDTSPAGAEGPMQFIPSTWDAYGVDGNGDGVANVCDYQDAILARPTTSQRVVRPATGTLRCTPTTTVGITSTT
ncbi:lytic transglycosylase domain-containing protein [Halocatena marina]|uniref:Lytic transglycosylase domain-containing protein n=1 Tax=Halocatena marina TaxID=2934937 RepID=A0ABD5YQ41_9EURY